MNKIIRNNEISSLILALGYLAWIGFVFVSIKGYLQGSTGGYFGGFGVVFFPTIYTAFGVGLRGTPLPALEALFWMLSAIAVNLAFILLVINAFVFHFRQARILTSVAMVLTLLIPFGGPWLNGYRALFIRYETVEECDGNSLVLRKYCHYVFNKEDKRKRDLEKCNNLGTDSLGDCVSEVALYTNNVALCDIGLIRYNKERESCVNQFRDELGDLGVCEYIRGKDGEFEDSSWWEECYYWTAKNLDDPQICEILPSKNPSDPGQDWQGYCLTDFAWARKDMKYCNRIRQLSPQSNEYYTCMKKLEQGRW
ncbi:hypothetical protein KKF55_00705 [Patescibacteria group bacterium]|nr:hypothetical protein [Patescibacteria group bacterium]